MRNDYLLGTGCFYGMMKSFETRERWSLCNIINILKTTDLFTLIWLTVFL